MKKICFLLCTAFISLTGFGQVEGDISASTMASGNHDDDNCMTIANIGYLITISNSFLNDSVKVVDPSNGTVLFSAGNSGALNPWLVTTPQFLFGIAPDQFVTNNTAFVTAQNTKIISGPDTLFLNNTAMVNVPNPCIYGNVSGKVYIDANSDCIFNTGDTPLNSVGVLNQTNITNTQGNASISNGAATDASGNYTAAIQETWMTDYTVFLQSNYQFIFPHSSCAPISYTYTTLPQTGADFALECADIDVSVYAYNSGAVRPGIPFMLHPRVQNEGCDAAAGTLKLVLDPNVTYNAGLSSNLPSSVSGDTLIWNYSNLSNLSNGAYWNSFISGIHLTPDVSINIGDTLCFLILTNVLPNDIDASNNQTTLCLPVVNSYDPNIKEVSPQGIGTPGYIPVSQNDLTYTIHFQNTGNAPAITVTVVDSLQENIDAGSLRILASSHSMYPTWTADGVVSFNFSSINLPDSASNEPASHGFVVFKVNLADNLIAGDEIKNTAHIYFDFNPAIVTNTTLNTLSNNLGIHEDMTAEMNVYPNPSSGIYNIKLPENTIGNDITVYNITGKQVLNTKAINNLMQIDISQFPSGIYVLSINGTSYKQRLIKR